MKQRAKLDEAHSDFIYGFSIDDPAFIVGFLFLVVIIVFITIKLICKNKK